MSDSGPLQFGIPSLDDLMQADGRKLESARWPKEPWTLAIVGPDGVGKSLLCLHLASVYAAAKERVHVLYASTDFSWYQANTSFTDFGLGSPRARLKELAKAYALGEIGEEKLAEKVSFEPMPLCGSDQPKFEDWRKLLAGTPGDHRVSFIDLQATTAGDDWGFLIRLLGLLPRTGEGDGPNLLVVDAVEGLEMFAGERDEFGEPRNRRSRMAQLVRVARASSTHLALAVEEPEKRYRMPEQFVADAVIRLRRRTERGYSLRTMEIEKCRGGKHVRGEHMLVIPTGVRGSATEDKNAWLDEPGIVIANGSKDPIPHMLVLPSLHYWHGLQARDANKGSHQTTSCPGFGPKLAALNALLKDPVLEGKGQHSAATGSLTLLLGESGTSKTRLAHYFLANAFRPGKSGPRRAAILLTTARIGYERLCACLRQISDWELSPGAEPWVRCRHLDPRFMTSGEFMRMLHRYVEEARKFCQPKDEHGNDRQGEVYLVMDDWSLFLSSHPEIASDPRFAPTVQDYLKTQAVHTLLVATQAVKPDAPIAEELGRDLRRLNEFQIHTWTVPFFGQQRTAITVIGPSSGGTAPTVYELRASSCHRGSPCRRGTSGEHCNERADVLTIDTAFALYEGLERGQPRRVPLEARLFGGYLAPDVPSRSSSEFHRYLDQKTRDLFFGLSRDSGVVRYETTESYNQLFHFARSLDTTRLEQTLILEVDEFWFPQTQAPSRLMSLDDYWNKPLLEFPERVQEVFPREQIPSVPKVAVARKDFFLYPEASTGPVNRIPYLRDFGFLLARRRDWAACAEITLTQKPESRLTVGAVWDGLCEFKDFKLDSNASAKMICWTEFFEAADIVAKATRHLPFDVDPKVNQTLLSLLLEVWLSSLYARFSELEKKQLLGGESPIKSLRELLKDNPVFQKEWYAAMLQIVCACGHLKCRDRVISRVDDRPLVAVASREWYSTASPQMREDHHDLVPLRLPGHFSTCGDWYLAVAGGSRSEPLAHAMLDLLSSREMSLLRAQDGIGLPVRRHVREQVSDEGLTRTSLRVWPKNDAHGAGELLCVQDVAQLAHPSAVNQFHLFRRSMLRGYAHDIFHLYRHLALLIEEQDQWIPEICRLSGNWKAIRVFCDKLEDGTDLGIAFNRYSDNIKWMLDVLSE